MKNLLKAQAEQGAQCFKLLFHDETQALIFKCELELKHKKYTAFLFHNRFESLKYGANFHSQEAIHFTTGQIKEIDHSLVIEV